ncbi:MAG TPA: hypothetical protein IAB05_01845 [Candidatus Stercoripulliclostridium merdigallinarum]|uniref:Uncharacterized protein n=1 Tax=Candidatus Stercoripulliclostridium merdigallinarum TaxID=2840951 RepID=A0A9D1MGP6_9FIRM|nr:hypothetical protein [Candidatus Stercoripulliclostridium merdigallinarum]
MNGNIRTLLRLEIKNRFSNYSLTDFKSYLKLLFTIVLLGAVIYAIYWVAGLFFEMFETGGMLYEALVLLVTAIFIFMLFTGISSTIKVLYYKGDNEILMRYPVSGAEVFISKTLFLFLSQFIVTTVVMAPFLVAYASVSGLGVAFYVKIPVPILLMVFINFFLSNILAIPIMHLTNRIRNKFILIIIGLAILVTAGFALYMLLFNSMVTYMNDTAFSVFSDEMVAVIETVAKWLIPAKYFADVMVGKELYIAYPALIGMLGLTLIGMIFIIYFLYAKTLLNNVEVEGSAFKHVTKNRRRPIFVTLLRKEFLQVFRSVNYSFQYFVLACAMPVMIYFCNEITGRLGENQIGEQIALGMTMLVMLIFATVITSFAATSTSREGDNFYHTKVAPVSIQKQLFAKFTMFFLVSVAANAVCAVVLYFTKQVNLTDAIWLFVMVELVAIAETLIAMRMDIAHPYFNLSGEGEVVNNNASTTLAVAMGFAVAVVIGIICMFLGYLGNTGFSIEIPYAIMDQPIGKIEFTTAYMYYAVTALVCVFFVAAVLRYSIGLKKAYNKIAK